MQSLPFISVVIPVYHDWPRLQKCLDALIMQSYPSELFEIIVVNNDPGDCPEILNKPTNMSLLSEKKPGSYAARNCGVLRSKGELIMFTDSDCIPEQNWIEKIVNCYMIRPTGLVSGQVEMFSEINSDGCLNFAESYDFIFGINQHLYAKKNRAATANLMVTKDVIDLLNGFNCSLFSGGDTDLCNRAISLGSDFQFCRKAIVKHPLRNSSTQLASKARRIIGGKLKRGKILALIAIFSSPIDRLATLVRKKAPLKTKIKALVMIFVIEYVQLEEALSLLIARKKHTR